MSTQVESETLNNLATAQVESNDTVVARKAKAAIKIALDRITSAVEAYDGKSDSHTDKALLASDLDNASKYCDSLRKQLKLLRSTVSIRNRVKAEDPKQSELPLTAEATPVVESLPV